MMMKNTTIWLIVALIAVLLVSSSLQQGLSGLQVHIAFTGRPFEYSIMCITQQEDSEQLFVSYKYSKTEGYTSSPLAFSSFTYTSAPYYSPTVNEVILQVKPSAKIVYFKIKQGSRTSKEYSFVVHDQSGKDSFTFLTYGDMDVTGVSRETMAHIFDVVSDASKKAEPDNIHFIVHQGDIPYAWSEEKWDAWGEMVEPITSAIPYMVAPGNHEANFDFTSYKSRFSNSTAKNSGSPGGNLFYSFNYRTVHFIALSSEHDFSPRSPQYKWLLKDLQQVDRSVTPFVITFSHRPQYSSNKNHGSALDFRASIEPVLVKYKVDLSLFGHVHAYERTCPIVGDAECGEQGVVNLCVGTAGYDLNPDWEDQPEWSLYRETTHGFARIKVDGSDSLTIQYLPNGEDRIGDTFTLYNRSKPKNKKRKKKGQQKIDYDLEKKIHDVPLDGDDDE